MVGLTMQMSHPCLLFTPPRAETKIRTTVTVKAWSDGDETDGVLECYPRVVTITVYSLCLSTPVLMCFPDLETQRLSDSSSSVLCFAANVRTRWKDGPATPARFALSARTGYAIGKVFSTDDLSK